MLQTWQVERESTVYRGALAYNDIWLKQTIVDAGKSRTKIYSVQKHRLDRVHRLKIW